MTTPNTSTDEAEVRALFAACRDAVVAHDIGRLMQHYTDDLVAFDAIGPLRFDGRAAYEAHWRRCLEMCPGTMIFDMHDLTLSLDGTVGFGHYLVRCGMTAEDGTEQASWMRCSVGLRKIDGQWRIAHEHFSAPFDPETWKAQFDLTP
ncbi:YybH family protein [Denitromonas iodatirespirans]|uniref:Nuclear transport factor 2 family protein n=1 Tax=Denitromonas iodatirespirans TaxID=2795389 RepID=A0A944DJF1_DENI1|nr:nuclear transport factor 2 family protein [Denitromonas iodatirespirans]MBT0964038.1 nuclear transport factor 2 family protein [Denitromonas iodatirespirans]